MGDRRLVGGAGRGGPLLGARLTAPAGAAASPGVTRLAIAETRGDETVVLAGERGVRGHVAREHDGLWLTVEGLPPETEDTKPVVAVPMALEVGGTTIAWAGDEPGLVAASEPVSGGTLRVRLGEVESVGAQAAPVAAPSESTARPEAAKAPILFDQVYLLHPELRR